MIHATPGIMTIVAEEGQHYGRCGGVERHDHDEFRDYDRRLMDMRSGMARVMRGGTMGGVRCSRMQRVSDRLQDVDICIALLPTGHGEGFSTFRTLQYLASHS